MKNDPIRKYKYHGYTIKYSGFHQMWEVCVKLHSGEGGTASVRPFKSKATAEVWVDEHEISDCEGSA